jgi:alkanesulfonate monooxygenase SsuD/methylene tetrahydromethanopterin reductase-like flavin-dependent oxidoreductase (luciferase family)
MDGSSSTNRRGTTEVTAFLARYDLRHPPTSGWTHREIYAEFLHQAAYLDTHGFDALVLCEHHGVDDGYLPAPMLAAAAAAAVTERIALSVAALLVNLREPVRLAEEIAVLDHLSGGRASYVVALGYRQEEYAMFGLPWERRGQRIEAIVTTILAALGGDPFECDGRTVTITPVPDAAPFILYGGGSVAAARRAGRLGLGFSPQVSDPALAEAYRAACVEAGHPEGLLSMPAEGPGNFFCAEDPDRFWDQEGAHLLHDARSYNSWHGELESVVRDRSTTVEDLRANGIYVVWTPEELLTRCRSGELAMVAANPLCGGLSREASRTNLRLMAEVLAELRVPTT